MFTGLIEEIGTIKSIKHLGGGLKFSVQAKSIMDDLKIDDSVSINGVCQTVTSRTNTEFEFVSVEETLRKTTLAKAVVGKKVNLERALRVSDRLGGHIVQGHVDCIGNVVSVTQESTGRLIWISYPEAFRKYVVPIGSIAIDGVSLTVAKNEGLKFMVAIIPHTIDITTLKDLKSGSELNIEFDILGKYIENMMMHDKNVASKKSILEKYIDQPD